MEKEEERTSVPRYAGPLLPPVGHERSLMACDFLTVAVASFESVLEASSVRTLSFTSAACVWSGSRANAASASAIARLARPVASWTTARNA